MDSTQNFPWRRFFNKNALKRTQFNYQLQIVAVPDASLNKDTPQVPLVPTPANARELVAQKSDTCAALRAEQCRCTAGEMRKALSAMRAMLADPGIIVRFAGQSDILSVDGLDDLGREIEIKQALFDFGAALVQFDLFGGFVEAPTKKNRRR